MVYSFLIVKRVKNLKVSDPTKYFEFKIYINFLNNLIHNTPSYF